MSNFIRITPFLHVRRLEDAIAFFESILGFQVGYRVANYAYLFRETVAFRILELSPDDAVPSADRRFAYYIDVNDLDLLHAELKPKLDTLPAADVHGPVNQSYGQRELMVVAPDGNLIVFGETIRK